MNWVFLSIIFGGSISLFFTPLFIKIQRKRKIGQRIRIDGPKSHSTKSGTPTMGGIVFIVAALISYAGVSVIKFYRHDVFSYEGIFIVSVFLMCGLIGFIDDYMSLKKQRSLGLRGWVKMLLLVIVCIYFFLVAKYVINLDTTISIPLTGLK